MKVAKSVGSVILGIHLCLDSDASDSETSQTGGSFHDDYNVHELGNFRVVSKVNDVAETASIDNSSDSESFDMDHCSGCEGDGNSQNVVKYLHKNLCIFHCYNCFALSCMVCVFM